MRQRPINKLMTEGKLQVWCWREIRNDNHFKAEIVSNV